MLTLASIIKVIYVGDIPQVGIVVVTEEQFEEYKNNPRMFDGAHFIDAQFVKKHLEDCGKSEVIKKVLYLSKGLAGSEAGKFMIEGVPVVIPVSALKKVLEDAGLNYAGFIDAYCAFLKNL